MNPQTSQSWLSRKWRKMIHPWKKDALVLQEILTPFRQNMERVKNFLLSLKKRKTSQNQILKKFFILLGTAGITGAGISLFLFFLGNSRAVFYLHIIFIVLSFLCLLQLIKRLRA